MFAECLCETCNCGSIYSPLVAGAVGAVGALVLFVIGCFLFRKVVFSMVGKQLGLALLAVLLFSSASFAQEVHSRRYYVVTPLDIEAMKVGDGLVLKAKTKEGVAFLHAVFDLNSDAVTWVPKGAVQRLLQGTILPNEITLPKGPIPLKADLRLEFNKDTKTMENVNPAPPPKIKVEKSSFRYPSNPYYQRMTVGSNQVQGRLRHQVFSNYGYSIYRKER